jgi:hypothetical protein
MRKRWTSTWIPAAGLGCALLTGCHGMVGDNSDAISDDLAATNGLTAINGLSVTNGLATTNGLAVTNGLATTNGLAVTNGLMTTAEGRKTVEYLVRCALPNTRKLTKISGGVTYTFAGEIGLAPEWELNACNTACQELVSACMMAHVNTSGQHIGLWIVGSSPALGWGYTSDFPYQEGSFFGNIFISPPVANYCNGSDFNSAIVPGRLGATQTGSPYKNPFTGTGYCRDNCVGVTNYTHYDAMGNADVPDGFTKCGTRSRVITVYREFDAATDYKLCNRQSGLCMDVAAGSTADGAAFDQLAYASTTRQKFRIVKNGPYYYSFKVASTGKMVSLSSSTLPETSLPTIKQYTAGSAAAFQGWFASPTGTGYFRLCSDQTFHCLSVGSNTSGSVIQGRPSTMSGPNMEWNILPAN